jgi:hypothetical protein
MTEICHRTNAYLPGHDLVSTTTSTLTTILNTVAPPISAHETLELWLAHPMVGYQGVESVVYRAWTRVLEQTESGELVVVWSAPPEVIETKRGMYPVQGWEIGWEAAGKEMEAIKAREENDPQGRGKEPNREWACADLVASSRSLTLFLICPRDGRGTGQGSSYWNATPCPSPRLPSLFILCDYDYNSTIGPADT